MQVTKKRLPIGKSISFILICLGGVTMIFPFLWMFSTALKESRDVFINPPIWIPNPPEWYNFIKVWSMVPALSGIKNTMIIEVFVLFFGMFASSLAAFAFAKLQFRFKNALFMALLSTMMIPYAAVMVPQFITFSKIGWVDTLLPLIIPGLFGNIAAMFFLRQFMFSIPTDYIAAAKVEGCSYFTMYLRIILPICKPAIAAQVILAFMGIWNDFLGPAIYLNSQEKMTLQAVLGLLSTQYVSQTNYPIIMAASIIAMLPTITVFIIFQKQFVETMGISSIKG